MLQQFENNTSSVNSLVPKPEKSHKFLLTLFALALISAGFAWWYLCALPQDLEPEIYSAKKIDPFVGWETYRNEKYGFEIKIPVSLGDYKILENTDHITLQVKDERGYNDFLNISVISKSEWAKWKESIKIGDKVSGMYITENTDLVFVYTFSHDLPGGIPNIISKGLKIISSFKFISIKDTENSGLKGLVTIGPTCPVERTPSDPQCADRPYQTKLRIVKEDTDLVRFAESDINGNFSIDLNPGIYEITVPDLSKQIPSLPNTRVVITEGKYTDINLQFDSGIR